MRTGEVSGIRDSGYHGVLRVHLLEILKDHLPQGSQRSQGGLVKGVQKVLHFSRSE
jgi:hypothetical protein